MKYYILFVIMTSHTHGAVSIGTADFNTSAACKHAATVIKETKFYRKPFVQTAYRVDTWCFPSQTKKRK